MFCRRLLLRSVNWQFVSIEYRLRLGEQRLRRHELTRAGHSPFINISGYACKSKENETLLNTRLLSRALPGMLSSERQGLSIIFFKFPVAHNYYIVIITAYGIPRGNVTHFSRVLTRASFWVVFHVHEFQSSALIDRIEPRIEEQENKMCRTNKCHVLGCMASLALAQTAMADVPWHVPLF